MTEAALTYGTALFDLATEENMLQAYMDEAALLRTAIAEEPNLLSLLDCRAVALKERLDIVDGCFRDAVQPYFLNYLKILCEKGMIRLLPECLRRFEILYLDAMGIVEAKATTAQAMSPALQEKLTKKLESITGKSVKLQCAVDESVLGGVRLEFMGRQFDGTVRRRLDEVSKSLSDLTL